MILQKAIQLIKPGIIVGQKAVWADLGSGDGLFTRALATLLGEGSVIYAVDTNRNSLQKITAVKGVDIKTIVANFENDELSFVQLSGILMANSLHFVKDKVSFIKRAESWLMKGASLLIVEYDMDTANRWVPYPMSYATCVDIFSSLGYAVHKIGTEISLYNRQGIFAAKLHH
jgi:ubiquinone/menaquinone biosynthesis C-methylase UbiE